MDLESVLHFLRKPSVGEAEYTLAPRHFKDVKGDMVGPATGFKLTLEMLRRKADSCPLCGMRI